MKRVKHTEIRLIKEISFTVNSLEMLDYDGKWYSGQWEVLVNDKSFTLYGWPTNNDLLNLLKSAEKTV